MANDTESVLANGSAPYRQIMVCGKLVTVLPDDGEHNQEECVVSSFIRRTAFNRSSINDHRAFCVIDLGDIVRKYQTWVDLLPDVVPHFAIKCLDDPVVASVLGRVGAGFDCASKNEIIKVLDEIDAIVDPTRIIYANPIKESEYIRYAAKRGVHLMTFDCEEELLKIKIEHPAANLVVRICVPPSPSSSNDPETTDPGKHQSMDSKFGCEPSEAVRLVGIADQLGLLVSGVSFYAGHCVYDSTIYERAIAAAKFVFDSAFVSFGRRLTLLDIGGGFYGVTNPRLSFQNAAAVLRSSISQHFGDELSAGLLRIIGEPGQYMTTSALTLVANVIGLRRQSQSQTGSSNGFGPHTSSSPSTKTRFHYYLNDGIFGSFRFYQFYNKFVETVPYILRYKPQSQQVTSFETIHPEIETPMSMMYDSTIWGPTCDSVDSIVDHCRIGRLMLGDWIVFEEMGRYATACASTFNGMPAPEIIYVIQERYVDCQTTGDGDGIPGNIN